MQIKKPKPSIPPLAIFLVLVASLFILSLPLLTKNERTKIVLKPESGAVVQVVSGQSDSKNEKKIVLKKIAGNLPSAAIPIEQLPAAVQAVSNPGPGDKMSKPQSADSVSLPGKPAAFLTSVFGNVKVIGADGEQKAEKNRQILKGETIEVGAAGEAVLEIEELYVLRLKPNTKLTQLEPRTDPAFSGKERVTYRFKLEQGALLGTTKYRGDKVNMLDLLIKDKVYNVQDSTFRVQLSDASPWIGVLRGNLKSNPENSSTQNPVVIHALEKVSLSDQPSAAVPAGPIKVSEQEWALLRETYEMNVKTAEEEAKQIDLSKRAGDFFERVFDHGTFYTENVGYTVRDFYVDKASGDVFLEAEYDVFPSNSFVGLYVLTRDLDANSYGGIRFDVRRKPGEGYPDRFYVEIKSKGQIIHRFEITDIKPDWQGRQIDFFSSVSTPITEVTLVFLNENIGQSKKGFIQMRNILMIPLTDEQKVQRAENKNIKPSLPDISQPVASNAFLRPTTPTVPYKKNAKRIETIEDDEDEVEAVPYKTDASRKIAEEVPKVVSFDDLSQ